MSIKHPNTKRRKISKPLVLSILLIVVMLSAGLGSLEKYCTRCHAQHPVRSTSENDNTPAKGKDAAAGSSVGSTVVDTDAQVNQVFEQMSLHEKVCQLFIVAPEQLANNGESVTQFSQTFSQALNEYPVGGIICFESNIVSQEQTLELLGHIRDALAIAPFLAVDEEGGTVSRIAGTGIKGALDAVPSMSECGMNGTENVEKVCFSLGKEIQDFGFNLDFAPVADINSNPDNPVIGTRAFSASAEDAAKLVASAVSGFKRSGALCCLKHFPGHGDTFTDSHYGLASTQKTIEEIRSSEFLPFQAGIEAGADFVMIGHISLPNVLDNKDTPASLSKYIITDVLKNELGYNGLVITDSLMMKAIADYYDSGSAAVSALKAGADILLMPVSIENAVSALETAAAQDAGVHGRIDESVKEVLKIKIESGIINQ